MAFGLGPDLGLVTEISGFSNDVLTSAQSSVHVLFIDESSAIIAPGPDDPEGRPEALGCAAEARTARQLAMLLKLAEIGMQMARAVRDEALAPAEPADEDAPPRPPSRFGNGDLGLVYSRVARAARQTVALETRVADGIEKARVEREQRRVAAIRRAADERQQQIRDYVTQAIEAEAAERNTPESEVERLLDDLDERLDEGDCDDALKGGAPIGELVACICADLGVTADWSLWEDQAWAIEHLKARALEDLAPSAGGIWKRRRPRPNRHPRARPTPAEAAKRLRRKAFNHEPTRTRG